jgi:hypothetical protein
VFPRPDRAHDQFLTPTRRHLFVVPSHSAWTLGGRAADQSACRHERYHVRVAKAVRTDSIWAVIGGVIIGYVLWLVAISIGEAFTTVGLWSLIVLIVSAAFALWAVLWGQRLRRRRNYPLSSFAFALPVLPVLLSLGVLADSYL